MQMSDDRTNKISRTYSMNNINCYFTFFSATGLRVREKTNWLRQTCRIDLIDFLQCSRTQEVKRIELCTAAVLNTAAKVLS